MEKKDSAFDFFDHLEELRSRLIKSVIFFIICSCFFYKYVDKAFYFFVKPVGRLIFTSPEEGFSVYMTLTLLGGVFLSAPFIFYQAWRFVSVGLSDHEKRYTAFFVPLSFFIFIGGALFGYAVILPIALKFFLSFSSPWLMPMITAGKYISFAGALILSFGMAFELPLVIAFLTKIGIVNPKFLTEKRGYVIVLIFIVSAVLTPPDCASQILMALPLWGLYEISILLSGWIWRLRTQQESSLV